MKTIVYNPFGNVAVIAKLCKVTLTKPVRDKLCGIIKKGRHKS